ncbi:MAG TPA: prephenate dehydrogenase [Candidatus Omnitrophota bacterium]|nr:prephenate dehydrogenase [Candidatus Omnitrophota bacterium]HPS19878.1 prephenate dehydrogenase [Candidatus Omnitrophota bacterium]
MKFKKVVIIGAGLIGGSIGKALLRKRIAENVTGIFRRRISLQKALKEKAVTEACLGISKKALSNAEIVFIATPVSSIRKVIDGIKPYIGKETIVTDAGSIKKEIVEYADRFHDKFRFVGGHPLAGLEKTGVESSSADLYNGAICVLTGTKFTDPLALAAVKEVWERMGAAVDILSPDKHDEILAFTSHLPHAVAYALAGVQNEDHRRYAASGFRDTTRIASSDPELWADIFSGNRKNMIAAIKTFRVVLNDIEKKIVRNDKNGLRKKLGFCKGVRDGIFQKS